MTRNTSAPKPYTQRLASTLFLRVPYMDWPRVKIGEKTEFRTVRREGLRLARANTPTPVVAYTVSGIGNYDRKLMVLEECRVEPLFELSQNPEAVAREGFVDYDHFRRYWRKRSKGAYHPMQMVHVWCVRLWQDGDVKLMGARLLKHLYGEYASDL